MNFWHKTDTVGRVRSGGVHEDWQGVMPPLIANGPLCLSLSLTIVGPQEVMDAKALF